MSKYKEFFDIIDILKAKEEGYKPIRLYPWDREKLLEVFKEKIKEHPSLKYLNLDNPFSGESILINAILYFQEILGYEVNLIPDALIYHFLSILGFLREESSFTYFEAEIEINSFYTDIVSVPIGSTFYSKYDDDYVILTDTILFEKRTGEVVKPCTVRFYKTGPYLKSFDPSEYNIIPPNLWYVKSLTLIKEKEVGKEAESLVELVERARSTIRRISPKLVTPDDFVDRALELGAKKALFLKNAFIDDNGNFYRDFCSTLVVYPQNIVSRVQQEILNNTPLGYFVKVAPAKVKRVTGTIELKIKRGFRYESFQLMAYNIDNYFNPPNNIWGDKNIYHSIEAAILKDPYYPDIDFPIIYGANILELIVLPEQIKFEEYTVEPWTLFEVDSSVQVSYIETST